jgi:2Fe-2S ferredoxin
VTSSFFPAPLAAPLEHSMSKIIFIEHNGTRREVEGTTGQSLMEAAIANLVPGIDADCGGACACATCHVHIGEQWLSKLEPMAPSERAMLEAVSDPSPSSRLSCQIKFRPELSGIEVHTPASQH